MGRIYYVPLPVATVTNSGGNADLWTIEPADDKPCKLRGFGWGQTSELGDTAEESVEIQLIHMTATVTNSNGTSATKAPVDSADSAAGFTAEYNGATVSTTTGATTVMMSIPWNLRASPYDFWFPDDRFSPKAKQGEALILRLISTVADDVSFGGWICVEEE